MSLETIKGSSATPCVHPAHFAVRQEAAPPAFEVGDAPFRFVEPRAFVVADDDHVSGGTHRGKRSLSWHCSS